MNETKYTYGEGSRAGQTSGRSLGWRDYAVILVERIWIALTVFVVVVALSLVYTQRQTPMYRAAARIMIETDLPKVLKVEDVLTFNTRSIEYFNSHVKALHSRSMAASAIEANGLDTDPRFTSEIGKGADPAAAAMRCVRIQAVPKSRMIDIIAEHPNAEIASALANGIAEAYIAKDLDRRMKASLDALIWLRQHAEEYRLKLEQGLHALQEYREATRAVSLEEKQDVVIAKLKAISARLTDAEAERVAANTQWNEVKPLLDAEKSPGEAAAIAGHEWVRQTRAKILEKESEIGLLGRRYKEKHPAIQRARSELEELETGYRRACDEAARQIESRHRMAEANVDSLEDALRRQEQQAFDLERKLVRYNELKRNAEADRQMYDAILARMKETSIAGDMQTSNIRLVDAARAASSPFKPSRRRNLINGLLVGALMGIALSFVAHFADDRLRRTEDVEEHLGLPVLAVIPNIGAGSAEERARTVHDDPRSAVSEAFRTLRASLALTPPGKSAKRIMITSAGAAEGKSLVACNLAIVYAQDSQKTLLIDADMKRPSLGKVFGVGSREGLSRVLAGGLEWEDAVLNDVMPNLDILTVGELPPNPAELLGSGRMRDMLAGMGEQYDRVVLDCPPVFGVSDPLVLLSVVDGLLFVAHFNKSRWHTASRALRKLSTGGTPILGAVMDNVDLRRPGTYYYYYHRYGSYRYYQEDDTSGRADRNA